MPGFQLLPEVEELTAPFWHSGADGVLRVQRCQACRWWIHTPKPRCPKCMSTDVGYEATSGRGSVWSYTINHQSWSPDLEVPYAIAIIELPEQEGLRMTTRLVDIALDQVRVGLPTQVVFEHVDDIYLPFFTAVE